MGKRNRIPKPGQEQARRMRFCIYLIGLGVVFLFLSAVAIGIPFPGVWTTVMVPFWMLYAAVIPLLTVFFGGRSAWLRAKAKHYETLMKLETDPRFK